MKYRNHTPPKRCRPPLALKRAECTGPRGFVATVKPTLRKLHLNSWSVSPSQRSALRTFLGFLSLLCVLKTLLSVRRLEIATSVRKDPGKAASNDRCSDLNLDLVLSLSSASTSAQGYSSSRRLYSRYTCISLWHRATPLYHGSKVALSCGSLEQKIGSSSCATSANQRLDDRRRQGKAH